MNRAVMCVVIIETSRGVHAAAEICAVAGVDAVMIGTADLALDLGLDVGSRSPDLDGAVATIGAAAARAGVAVMIGGPDTARLDGGEGQHRLLLIVTSDAGVLRQGLRRHLGSAGGAAPY